MGEHTGEILAEIGVGDAEMQRLRTAKII